MDNNGYLQTPTDKNLNSKLRMSTNPSPNSICKHFLHIAPSGHIRSSNCNLHPLQWLHPACPPVAESTHPLHFLHTSIPHPPDTCISTSCICWPNPTPSTLTNKHKLKSHTNKLIKNRQNGPKMAKKSQDLFKMAKKKGPSPKMRENGPK